MSRRARKISRKHGSFRVRARSKTVRKKVKRRVSERYIAPGPAVITIRHGKVAMLLPRRLRSPNARGGHWAEKRERDAWQQLLEQARVVTDASLLLPVHDRMRLEIVRLTPSRRFLMDKDNADWAGKRLQDSLRAVGYIVDDNAKWLDGPYVSQGISSDKYYWTLVKLSAAGPYVDTVEILNPHEEISAFLRVPSDTHQS